MGKLKILVLGDGLLGSEIIKQTGCDYLSRKKDGFDITNTSSWNFSEYNILINCIANTDTYSNDRDSHWLVNYQFVYNLIEYCNSNNIKLVHISTEYLYTGSADEASENDVPVHCQNWYGYTKLLGDGLVQLLSKDYLICRCMHKPNPFLHKKAWVDQIGNFDYVDVISSMIINCVNIKLSGVFNIGTKIKSIYDLAIITNTDVRPILSPRYIPKNISMSVDKFNNIISGPFFSIAIPTYEYGGRGVEFLTYSFQKISEQTFKNFEVVISDHSLNTEIEELCNQWNDKFKIIYIKNNHGRGIISPNINTAMKNCNGKYIKILFQDDFLYNSSSLEFTYHFIIENDVRWMVTAFFHSDDGINMHSPLIPVWNDNIWTGNNSIGCPTGICIKNEDILFFDENLNWMMDVDFYKRMYDKYGEPSISDDFTVVNRTWGERLTDTITQDARVKEFRIMVEKYA